MSKRDQNVRERNLKFASDIDCYPIWSLQREYTDRYSSGYWTRYKGMIYFISRNEPRFFAYCHNDGSDWIYVYDDAPDHTIDLENWLMEELL